MNKLRIGVSFFIFMYSALIVGYDNGDCTYIFDKYHLVIDDKIKDNLLEYKTGFDRLNYFLSIDRDRFFRYKTGDLPLKKSSKTEDQSLSMVYPPSLSVVAVDIRYNKLETITSSSIMDFLQKASRHEEEEEVLKEIYEVFLYLKQHDYSFYSRIISDIRTIILSDSLRVSVDLKKSLSNNLLPRYSMYHRAVIDIFSRIQRDIVAVGLAESIYSRIKESNFSEDQIDEENIIKKGREFIIKNLNYSFYMALSLLYYEYYYGESGKVKCSGIVVSHNTLITAAHCIYQADQVFFTRNGQRYESEILSYNTLYKGLSITDKEGFYKSSEHDIGVLVFPDNTFRGIPPAKLAKKMVSSTERIIITGFDPITREFAAQCIAGKSVSGGRKVYLSREAMYTVPGPYDLKGESGSSGSPVFNERDQVVALLVSGSRSDVISGKNSRTDVYVKIDRNLDYLRSVCEQYGCKITGLN